MVLHGSFRKSPHTNAHLLHFREPPSPVLFIALGQPFRAASHDYQSKEEKTKHSLSTCQEPGWRSQGDTLGSWRSNSLAILLGLQDPKGDICQ